MAKNNRISLFIALIPLVLFTLQFFTGVANADGHKKRESGYKAHAIREEHHDSRDHTGRRFGKEDDGNEVTGQTAAWLLVAANFTAVLSMFIKNLVRYYSFEPETLNLIKRVNQLQKRHLMRFHYVLNPVALCMAGIHYSLSSCRSSPLPEWGLLCLAVIVLLGLTVKLRLAPKRIQRVAYRLHTGFAAISVMIILLVAGHMIVD